MGIDGLHPFVASCSQEVHVSQFRGRPLHPAAAAPAAADPYEADEEIGMPVD